MRECQFMNAMKPELQVTDWKDVFSDDSRTDLKRSMFRGCGKSRQLAFVVKTERFVNLELMLSFSIGDLANATPYTQPFLLD